MVNPRAHRSAERLSRTPRRRASASGAWRTSTSDSFRDAGRDPATGIRAVHVWLLGKRLPAIYRTTPSRRVWLCRYTSSHQYEGPRQASEELRSESEGDALWTAP